MLFLQIYIVSIKGGETPKELTSGKQGRSCDYLRLSTQSTEKDLLWAGTTASPVFNPSGDKVAWLEMEKGTPVLSF